MRKLQPISRIIRAVRSAVILMVCCGLSSVSAAKKYPEEHFNVEGLKKGPRSLENIQETMNLIMPRLYYLYAQSQAGMSLREGIILMWLVVDRKGMVTYVGVHESTVNDEIFEDVLEATLADVKFSKWKKGKEKTEIIYPLEFRKENSLAAPKSRARKVWDRKKQAQRTTDSLIQSLINQVDRPDSVIDSTSSTDTTADSIYQLESEESRGLMR